MNTRGCTCILFLMFCLMCGSYAIAQQRNSADTILMGAVIENGDTLGMVYLEDFLLRDRLPAKWVKRQAENNRLKYNIYKVYPYAVIAAGVLKDADKILASLPTKKARKEYIKSMERELKSKFKNDLENLSMTQGQVLVKLINRQTGRNCFSILREVKGGFNAVVYQSVALLFNNNLKREYDPEGRDQDMEKIVRELEATNYYRYYYSRQQQLQTRRN
ncbi:MAG: DUF4294 domain-containing protein [Chitinophagaceae bacterium]|nr:MAG: DUF4294 domain-containing protein [Chitinophagaceae bacterium]